MNQKENLTIAQEIESTLIAYWHDVDRNWGAGAHEFYTEDCVYTTSAKTRHGRDAIAEFYASRKNRGERVSRHLVSNLHVEVHDADHATCRWVMMLYAADGMPVLPADVPNLIADSHDEYVRAPDGRWLCASRRLIPLFKSATPTTA